MIRITSLGAVLLLAVPAFAAGSPGREAKVERLKARELEREAPLGKPNDHPLWP